MRYPAREGTSRTGKPKNMDEAAEGFMDAWLDVNVTHRHAKKPSSRTIKALANRCIQDATAAGISLDGLKEVVVDIEEAITDELNFIAAMEAKKGGS
jgi:hypothetical protein